MIDLRSDTVTKPDESMREAAAKAAVGDDVYGEDPTVNDLETQAADRLGMEAALFVPSGTMGNQLAAFVHTDPGQEVLADRESHVVRYELGGLAVHSGLQVRMIDADPRGIPTPEEVAPALVSADAHRPGTGLCCLENTHNVRGGLAIEPSAIEAATAAIHEAEVPVHLDGARLFNAAVSLDEPVTAFTDPVDSVMVCLSKGLGAPIGSILAGNADFVERARRARKLFGGGMRQAGLVAAPGLLALENASALAVDHELAEELAAGLDAVPGLSVTEPETNIVLVDIGDAGVDVERAVDRLADAGVGVTAYGPTTIRLCTHRDLDRDDVETAVTRIRSVFA